MDVDFIMCGFLPGCSYGSEGFCKTYGCCSVCLQWQVGGPNPGGVCLGAFNHQVFVGDDTLTLVYTRGDPVVDPVFPINNGPRMTYIYLQCGKSPLADVVYTDASELNPNHTQNQIWVYNINATSYYACNSNQKLLFGKD
eukprot:TRINITY_DN12100_c0_g1_i1.p1 TRINITY_DN12100_c0_g1~~TRINITY_DN12100_c0_g1_i1.p1  ORF type:complete len:140 (+),score=4.79 TRINITY_DN12100_c0_g1_i1:366-785(+)